MAAVSAGLMLAPACNSTSSTSRPTTQNASFSDPWIEGYDPVAYWPEGGGKPREGRREFSARHDGRMYWFATAENRSRFVQNPERYAPAYGGWCAWAMVQGEEVEVDSESFIIEDDRLFLFYDGFLADTRKKWLAGDHRTLERKADAHWAGRKRR